MRHVGYFARSTHVLKQLVLTNALGFGKVFIKRSWYLLLDVLEQIVGVDCLHIFGRQIDAFEQGPTDCFQVILQGDLVEMDYRRVGCVKSGSLIVPTRVIVVNCLVRPFETSQNTENTPCLGFFGAVDLINECLELVILQIVLSVQLDNCNFKRVVPQPDERMFHLEQTQSQFACHKVRLKVVTRQRGHVFDKHLIFVSVMFSVFVK
jgi:hypothetical protein